MQHFHYIYTHMTDRECLLRAIRDLNYDYRQVVAPSYLEIRGTGGRSTFVEITIRTRQPGYSIGFRKVNGVYVAVADWICIQSVVRNEFIKHIKQRYAYHMIQQQMHTQGFIIRSEELCHKGYVHLILQRTS